MTGRLIFVLDVVEQMIIFVSVHHAVRLRYRRPFCARMYSVFTSPRLVPWRAESGPASRIPNAFRVYEPAVAQDSFDFQHLVVFSELVMISMALRYSSCEYHG
ncbi:uncharacterized protein Bfra_011583 [Botrytis fragariae]|uniref:Uncharacterized protein n=1 Tax=Botrytis fragariae TaxID=1964551 RepID=A0A8H6EEA9_9HELO|nr:uncharacterized protein Bfra_011583 [Botrytis fragariae]KAF5869041.1 hypothetical protein Bfra_011583 [Botrytis fragariae]